jgi:hypothetical protein
VIECGVQEIEWEGQLKRNPKVAITFETVTQKGEFNGEKKPFVVTKDFTMSNHAKSGLMKFLNGINKGEITYLDELLDTPCLVNIQIVEKGGKHYANVVGVNPPMEGMDTPKAYNDLVYFSFDEPTEESVAKLHKWEIDNRITKAINYDGSECQRVIESTGNAPEAEEDFSDEERQPWDN